MPSTYGAEPWNSARTGWDAPGAHLIEIQEIRIAGMEGPGQSEIIRGHRHEEGTEVRRYVGSYVGHVGVVFAYPRMTPVLVHKARADSVTVLHIANSNGIAILRNRGDGVALGGILCREAARLCESKVPGINHGDCLVTYVTIICAVNCDLCARPETVLCVSFDCNRAAIGLTPIQRHLGWGEGQGHCSGVERDAAAHLWSRQHPCAHIRQVLPVIHTIVVLTGNHRAINENLHGKPARGHAGGGMVKDGNAAVAATHSLPRYLCASGIKASVITSPVFVHV